MDKQTQRKKIIQRAAQEIRSDMVINLGIGMPTLVANEMNDHVENVFSNLKMVCLVLAHILLKMKWIQI